MHQAYQTYQARRETLFAKMADNSAAVLFAKAPQYRNRDTEFPYRPDSTFYYLTGFAESHAIVVLIKRQQKTQTVMFCRMRDPNAEQWDGPRLGPLGVINTLGVNEAFAIDQAAHLFPDLLQGLSRVYWMRHEPLSPEQHVLLMGRQDSKRYTPESPSEFHDLAGLVDEMRLIKSPEECASLQTAGDISVRAHLMAMQGVRPGMHEFEIEAILLKAFYERGSRSPAYPAIVAGGSNACILHYTQNNAVLKAGDLLLIDAGAEYDYLAADITRTFPVSGKFSADQQAIYELVLAAQTAAIASIKPGAPWDEAQNIIINCLVTGLVDLKILQGDIPSLIAEKAYLPFYMHNSGHWLGMDVHDVGRYKIHNQARALEVGMVFTIEPGLYISADNLDVEERWRGIGVRIEDDLVVREQGCHVFTEALPRSVAAIEQLMAHNRV